MVTRTKTSSRSAHSAHLLDINVLIALAWPNHVHHTAAHDWFETVGHRAWATCPLTQLGFVRISSNPKIIAGAASPRAAMHALNEMMALPGHTFWPDDLPLGELKTFASKALVGHRQVTDAYLIELAHHHKGRLATLDGGLADLLPPAEREKLIVVIA